MKKKHFFLICITLLILVGIAAAPRFIGHKPLKSLMIDEIEQIDVELLPPDKKITLTAEETAQLVPLLHDVVTYQKDQSYSEYDGQAVVFTIYKKDGTTATVMEYNPFVVLNGVGYRAKYAPCEVLSHFANELARAR